MIQQTKEFHVKTLKIGAIKPEKKKEGITKIFGKTIDRTNKIK